MACGLDLAHGAVWFVLCVTGLAQAPHAYLHEAYHSPQLALCTIWKQSGSVHPGTAYKDGLVHRACWATCTCSMQSQHRMCPAQDVSCQHRMCLAHRVPAELTLDITHGILVGCMKWPRSAPCTTYRTGPILRTTSCMCPMPMCWHVPRYLSIRIFMVKHWVSVFPYVL